MANQIIEGQVLLEIGDVPMTGIKVEFWDSTHGWIASVLTGWNGVFKMSVSTDYFIIPSPPDPEFFFAFRVFKDNVQIGEKRYEELFDTESVQIKVFQKDYDDLIPDTLPDALQTKFMNISGRVTVASGVPVTNLAVRLVEVGMKAVKEIVRVQISIWGKYNIRVNSKLMGEMLTFYKRGFMLEVIAYDDYNNAPQTFGNSSVYYDWKDEMEIDIVVDTDIFPPPDTEYIQLREILAKGGLDNLNGMNSSLDEAVIDQIIRMMTGISGVPADTWQVFIKALMYAGDIIKVLDLDKEDEDKEPFRMAVYGLLRINGGFRNPLDTINDRDAVINCISAAADDFIVPASIGMMPAADFAVSMYVQYKSLMIANADVPGEIFKVQAVFDKVFSSPALQASYLDLSLQKFDSKDAFWAAYGSANGFGPMRSVQKGLRLVSLTGAQPEMIEVLLPADIPGLSLNSFDDWQRIITDVSAAASRLCVPTDIKNQAESDAAAIDMYAARLKELAQNSYPLTNIASQLDKYIIPDNRIREQVQQFIAQNPYFDIRRVKADDIDNGDYDLAGISDVAAVKEELYPFQRLLRVTNGAPDVVIAMRKNGIASASAIVELSLEAFTAAYQPVIGTLENVQVIYSRALTFSTVAKWTYSTQERAFRDWEVFVLPTNRYDPVAEPNLETLFHNGDYCSCNECLSLYSPAAYYTDILHFLKKYTPAAYTELVRRRPDLVYIDLTCKNTNTAMPYIDLVNELLENTILAYVPSPPVLIGSYQTQGVTKELNAYPEHVIRNNTGTYEDIDAHHFVYDTILPNAIYPYNLPFSLPVEETRTYLQHLGISRYASMRLFRSGLPADPLSTDVVTGTAINSEYLQLTIPALAIITDTTLADAWKYYGFTAAVPTIPDPSDSSASPITGNWYDLLGNRLDVLLHYGRFSYEELLQILTCAFLNPYDNIAGRRPVGIVSTDPAHPDTCVLKNLKLDFTDNANKQPFFRKLVRFIRLIRTNKLQIHQWDILFRSLGITNITVSDYNVAMLALQLSDQLNIVPEHLCFWWDKADQEHYADYNSEPIAPKLSVYDKIFRSRASVSTTLFPQSGPAPVPYNGAGNAALIASVCKVKEEELFLLLDALGIVPSDNMSLLVVSKVYILGRIAKALKYTVKDLLVFAHLLGMQVNDAPLGILVQSNPTLANLLSSMLDLSGIVKSSVFSLAELDFLLRNNDDRQVFVAKVKTIAAFYTGLRTELQKYSTYVPPVLPTDPEKLAAAQAELKILLNVIFQQFVKEFNIPLEWAMFFVKGYDMDTATVSGDIAYLLETLVAGNESIEQADFKGHLDADNDFSAIFSLYRSIQKSVLAARKLKINDDEFSYFYQTSSGIDFDFTALPVLAGATGPIVVDNDSNLFAGFLRLCLWIQVRDGYDFDTGDLVSFIKAVHESDKETWMGILVRNTAWDNLKDLVDDGAGGPGILGESWPSGFMPDIHTDIQRTLSILDIMYWCRRTGLNPAAFRSVLQGAPLLDNSYKVMLAAKAKHGDSEWLTVARPIRDVLRMKQRDALAAFVLHYPALVDERKWQDENDVYAYLLIDVEMQSCMQTSRLKQAISSVQLFVDRILLGLEYTTAHARIDMAPLYVAQWESWRKWYRIWEANRKIFLYPENWTEPELRDGKSSFFTDLEQDLSQGELNDDLVSNALFNYLQKLDEVAKLEPVGHYYDNATQITHVVARTIGAPHSYFYRQLKDDEWTAWEPVDASIDSEHVAPVFWKGKFHLFWITFVEKKGKVKQQLEFVNPANTYDGKIWTNIFAYNPKANFAQDDNGGGLVESRQLEVKLNWAEYKNGKWLKQKEAKEPAVIKFYPDTESFYNNTINDPNAYFGSASTSERYSFLTRRGELSIMEMVRTRFFMHHSQDATGNLYIKLTYPLTTAFAAGEEYTFYLQGYKFSLDALEPQVWREPDSANVDIYSWTRPSPYGTVFYNSRLLKEIPFANRNPSLNNKLFIDSYANGGAWQLPFYPSNSFIKRQVQVRNGSAVQAMLKTLPYNQHIITTDAAFRENPLEKQFFFEDDRNTFFVRKIDEGYVTVTPPVWTGSNYAMGIAQRIFKYNFFTFYHAHVKDFIKALNAGSVDGLMDLRNQVTTDTIDFFNNYIPNTDLVRDRYPSDKVDFDANGAYALYNWELFFHAPMMVAQRLSTNQQFAEARKWYHYIFDPTSNLDDRGGTSTGKQRFWRFRPFYEEAGRPVQTLNDLLDLISQNNANAVAQVTRWENNPFKPHLIARMRVLAYMKNVVMKYLDNLIAWGDQLFSRDTIESINEATQLYILAANILGKRPDQIPQRAYTAPKSFDELAGSLDAFSNALVQIENYIDPNLPPAPNFVQGGVIRENGAENNPERMMYYFCLSPNPKLMGYWDTVADRLFKIRNCMNISGQVRQLPLFEPPIDPALLVRAAAAGISTESLLNSLSASPALYRFNVLLQKANELCGDVKSLGGAILAALEKKDAEAIALLRSSQEINLLDRIRQMKEIQVQEAQANIEAAAKTREVLQLKFVYYSSRERMNENEKKAERAFEKAQNRQKWSGIFMAAAQLASIIPQFHAQALASGTSFGGQQISSVLHAVSTVFSILAQYKQAEGGMAATSGSYDRRMDDWNFQASSAAAEIQQAERQVVAAQIRKSIAEKDLENQQLQIENAKALDEYMRSKFTNQQLYDWMISQIAVTYFQSYQLAYDTARKAEACFDYELPLAAKPADGYIRFGYWDSLKKGLLSGEKLQYDLRKLDMAYLNNNRRELELTRHISLSLLDPQALMALCNTGSCTFTIPEILYDMDFPGHYNRRIRSVSISIPCVAGPYTTINATLVQISSRIRYKADLHDDYVRVGQTADNMMATSSGQNDSGLFELNFRDERYLPFEYSGADSDWSLTLAGSDQLRLFDFNTITDAVVHVKYTAINSGDTGFKNAVLQRINNYVNDTEGLLHRFSSLNREFSNEWNLYADRAGSTPDATVTISLDMNFFPYFCNNKEVTVTEIHVSLRQKPGVSLDGYQLHILNEDDEDWGSVVTLTDINGVSIGTCGEIEDMEITPGSSPVLQFKMLNAAIPGVPVNMANLVDDFFFVVAYHLA